MVNILAPGKLTHLVSIRSGKKPHEVMIPEDDARMTIELDDRYIISPEFSFWNGEPHMYKDGKAVDEGFIYSSNTKYFT